MKHLAFPVMVFALGFSIAFNYQVSQEVLAKNDQISNLEKALRTKTGQLYDLQEHVDEKIQDGLNQSSLKLWETENKLNECLKGKK